MSSRIVLPVAAVLAGAALGISHTERGRIAINALRGRGVVYGVALRGVGVIAGPGARISHCTFIDTKSPAIQVES